MDYFDEINKQHSLFCHEIEELDGNSLLITVYAGIVDSKEEDLKIGDVVLKGLRSVDPDPDKGYKLYFERYIAYQVINESYTYFDQTQVREGRLLCIYSQSHYLNFIMEHTIANSLHENELKHLAVNCNHHTIDIIAIAEPVIARLF